MADDYETARHLHRLAVERFLERRRLEWRLSFSAWVGLISLSAFALRITSQGWRVFVAVAAILLAVFHGVFENNYFPRQMEADWKDGINFDKLLREAAKIGFTREAHSYNAFFSHWWQIVITVALTVGVVAICFGNPIQ